MLRYLSTDPLPITVLLLLLAGGFVIAVFVTQRSKYLVAAATAAALAVIVVAVEQFWVTDEERIEAIVYALARGAENSDFVAVDMHLAPDVMITTGDSALDRRLVVAEVSKLLEETRFDFIRISRLSVHAGSMSRQGSAEFRVQASCTVDTPYGHFNYMTPPSGQDWSLGFRETSPGTWKVTRISPPLTLRSPFGFPRR